MATKTLGSKEQVSVDADTKIAIVHADWNEEITSVLRDGAVETCLENSLSRTNIVEIKVPGSYELPMGAQYAIESLRPDAVICLGCVIQGETPHFDYICQAVAQGIKDVSIKYSLPVIFGVLTTLNHQQALDRAGGKHGNKGEEAAYTALEMIRIKHSL